MSSKFNTLSEDDKYLTCKRAVEAAQKLYKNETKNEFSFQTNEGYVNLLSVRGLKNGSAVVSKNSEFDDTLFLVYVKDGKKCVKEFEISTEFGTKGTALLLEGQYRYTLSYHLTSKYSDNQPLKDGYKGSHNYRALKINQVEGATIIRDKNRDLDQDSNESIETGNMSINIHYGGEKEGTSNWSEGCQVIKGWENYKDVIKTIESDYSIIGTINNELSEKPLTDGTRYVVYTLIKGTDFENSDDNYVFPVSLNGTNELSIDNITKYYSHTEKETEDGYFPVGSNTLWHGGLHIFTAEGSDVYACMPGKIVAGRLADDTAFANGPFGHRNFLLLKHTVKEKDCFSLYMHMKEHPLSETDEFIKKLKWLQKPGGKSYKVKTDSLNYRSSPEVTESNKLGSLSKDSVVAFVEDATPEPWKKVKLADNTECFIKCSPDNVTEIVAAEVDKTLLGKLKSGNVVKLDCEIQAGDLLWKSGKYGPSSGLKGLVHWEIFSADNLVASDSTATATPSEPAKPTGLATGYTNGSGIKVRGVIGPAKAKVGENIVCSVTKIDYSDAPESELNNINWKVMVDSEETVFQKHGYKLNYTIPETAIGKQIKVYAYMSQPSESYCVKLQPEQCWTIVEDPDEDFNAESDVIKNHFGELLADEVLTPEELKKFYADNTDGKAEKMRNFVCKFASEWGVADLDTAIKALTDKGWLAKADDYKPYIWWREVINAGVTLPSAHVWHYNPVKFLETFGTIRNVAASDTVAPAAQATSKQGIKKCSGPAFATPGIKVVCQVDQFNLTPTADDKKKVSWCVKQNGTIVSGELPKGEKLTYLIPETTVGDILTVHPYINGLSDSVCVKIPVGPCLFFNGTKMQALDKNCKVIKEWAAMSGLPEHQKPEEQKLKDQGPIPEGYWYVKQDQLQHRDTGDAIISAFTFGTRGEWPGGEDRWGNHRVWLSPVPKTETNGRSGFCIHGGKTAGSAGCIDLTSGMDGFTQYFEGAKADLILVVRYSTLVSTQASLVSNLNIDWAFIGRQEGTRNSMYVPKNNGVVLGNSGPTIATGFDLGQIDLAGLKSYNYDALLQSKLEPYVGKKGTLALTYVEAHPLTLNDTEITTINKKVKDRYANKAESFFNKTIAVETKKFKNRSKEVQTVFASVYFQYGETVKFLKLMVDADYLGAIKELLNFTSATAKIKRKTSSEQVTVMEYLPRRCEEARYLLKTITDTSKKTEAEKLIVTKENTFA